MSIERKSKQRDAILNELKSRYDHPTAMELYLAVRERIPNLSLGTLYRNLAQLEECGEIVKIHDGHQDRFDGNALPHTHFKCNTCGRVYDIHQQKAYSFDYNDEYIGQIDGYTLMLFGICKQCNC